MRSKIQAIWSKCMHLQLLKIYISMQISHACMKRSISCSKLPCGLDPSTMSPVGLLCTSTVLHGKTLLYKTPCNSSWE